MKALALLLTLLTSVAYSYEISLTPDNVNITTRTLQPNSNIKVTPEDTIQSIEYYVDSMSNKPVATIDIGALPPGKHTIYAVVRTKDGKIVNLEASTIKPTPTPTPQTTIVKWHPGHYIFVGRPDPSAYATTIKSPYIKGVIVRYFWARPGDSTEIAKDKYDFSKLEAKLKELQAAGKRFGIFVGDQDYWGNDCVPAYMKTDSIYKGGQFKTGNRCVPKYWVPAVMDRVIAHYKALGKRFNSEPYVEFVHTNEIAAGLESLKDPDYSKEAFVAQMKRLQKALVEAFPNTVAIMGANWAPGIGEIIDNAYTVGIGIGGPDLFVDPPFKINNKTWRATDGYPYYKKYRGKMPLEIGGQVGLEVSIKAGRTVPRVFDYAVRVPEGLQVNYMSWSYPYGIPNFSFDKNILPYIESQKGFIENTACPENITKRGRCSSQ